MPTVNAKNKGAAQDMASRKKEPSSNTFEGKVVSITGNKLVMTNKTGKEYSHTLAKDAKLTREGVACKAEEFKAGSEIRVTTKKDDRNVVASIESLDKKTEFEKSFCH